MEWIILFVGLMIASVVIQNRLRSKFKEYSQLPVEAGLTGREVAEKMLRDHHIHDVKVVSVQGQLTDHYNPSKKTVNLSPDVFNGRSVAAAAVAAHECGHAVQHHTSYAWLTMRSTLVPLVNASSKLMNVLIIMIFLGIAASLLPYTLAIWILVAAQAVITLFALVTLPVEYDASSRALVWLREAGITSFQTQEKAEDALKWAARTYLVSALAAVATMMYYITLAMGRD